MLSDTARRVGAGAWYGLIGGTFFVLLAGTVDVLTLRDLPLRVDWAEMGRTWLAVGLGLALVGALTAWPRAAWRGIVASALGLAVLTVAANLAKTDMAPEASFILLLFSLPSVAVLVAPLALFLRWLTHRHEQAAGRLTVWLGLLALTAGVGAGAGFTQRMPSRAESAVRRVQAGLTGSGDPLPISKLPGYAAHAGQAHTLSQRASDPRRTTIGFDITTHFPDGYQFTCVVLVYSNLPAISGCTEGQLSGPP